mmetsp:Transcript_30842/g.65496  ORF Transcript_30842/g.65496 Transcript_30842/m.65496 type:complete len:620 (-) Transcript_30842:228-2087(-)
MMINKAKQQPQHRIIAIYHILALLSTTAINNVVDAFLASTNHHRNLHRPSPTTAASAHLSDDTSSRSTADPTTRRKVVIIGAGWGGLSTAHSLAKANRRNKNAQLEITLVDSSPRVGGLVRDGYTSSKEKRSAEAGQHGFWDNYHNIFRFLEEDLLSSVNRNIISNDNNNNNNNINNINPEEPTNGNYTSAAELEKLIRAIGTNPNLDTKQKNLTIQGLRDSVWKSNCRLSKRKREEWEDETSTAAMEHTGTQALHSSGDVVNPDRAMVPTGGTVSQPTHHLSFAGARPSASVGTRFKRETPPSCYYRKNKEGDVQLAWKHDPHSTSSNVMEASVPLFSAAELAPTYHDGGINRVLGCPHYARSCKLRHPTSGRLYTCRLCCEQDREMATKDKDSPLDRYEVKEILCMICGALQPAGKHCVNPECASEGKPFARYSCGICNFYDNSPDKAIYHCPFCNVCRSGRGLGIDYRHCMRCNACVSLTDEHHCIPQRLQANCPICHETMFQSTEPLRGLQCGHVMHLNCFTMYMRGGNYTCPLCKKSAEDMTEYFALLDSAIRMQPMPPAYTATTSNIYCQDCGKMGNVSYHFVGLKCQHCGSFNTRELQRVDPNIMASLWQGY